MSKQKFGVSLSFDVGLAKEVGIEAAVVYNQLKFWGNKGRRKDGWVYKSYADMLEDVPISEYQLRKTYKLLVNAGIIEIKIIKINKSPTLHYRFLKNFTFDLVSLKTSETMVSLKTSETSIYTEDNHNTTGTASLTALGKAEQGAQNSVPPDLTKSTFTGLVKILHPGQEILFTPGRRSKLNARLEKFDQKQLCDAAKNLMSSGWHVGMNPTNTKYASFDFLVRKDEMVEKWLNEKPIQTSKSGF